MKKQLKRGRRITRIFNFILIIATVAIIYQLWHIYRINDFGDFIKAEYTSGLSNFSRDDIVKYSDMYSYKIESPEFNDALIYKSIDVDPNTVYRVTCMVKFENVENEDIESEGGVNIGIMDTTEKSNSLIGSGDWQKISFEFDSKSRNSVDIVFRLGSYDDNSKGKVWFSDFTLEKGVKDESNNWNFICLIMKNIEVNLEDKGNTKVKMQLEPKEITLIEDNMRRFQTSMKEMSNGLMTVTYKTFVVDKPITSISYNEEYGYYVSSKNLKEILREYVDDSSEEYDHVFVAYKLGQDLHEERITTGDWIGLGGMIYKNDIGFSNIRIPNEEADTLYTYSNYNTFPEEVFVHEFLHNMERIENELQYEVPELHSYEKYGYKESNTEGLKKWYYDYMNCKINNGQLGLNKQVYKIKPVKNSCFNNSIDLTNEQFYEPKTLVDQIKSLLDRIRYKIQ